MNWISNKGIDNRRTDYRGEIPMIGRKEAVKTLDTVIYSGILAEDIEDALKEISNCIEAEEKGWHLWDADSDYMELFIGHREDLWTDELVEKVRKINKKYTFRPSPFERGEKSDTEGHEEDAEKD